MLYELPCEWNYHAFQCKPDRTENPPITRQRNGINLCKGAAKVAASPFYDTCLCNKFIKFLQNGAAIIHGSCSTLKTDPIFRVIFIINDVCIHSKIYILQEVNDFWGTEGVNKMKRDEIYSSLKKKLSEAVSR